MSAILAAAAIGGGISLLNMGIGGLQARRGRKEYESLMRRLPKYQMQQEYQGNVNLAKEAYIEGMPGKDIARNMLYASTEAGLSRIEEAATSSTDLLGATTDLYSKQLDKLNEQAFAEAQVKTANLERLMNANYNLAGEKTKQWEYNEWLPSQMKLNISSSKFGGGQQQFQAGLQNLAGVATNTLASYATMKSLNSIYGNSPSTPSGIPNSGTLGGTGYNAFGSNPNAGASVLPSWEQAIGK